ncbi:MAG: hypothetical protein HKN18_10570 [Silicimonas sp.]|nr:hypothetical protein [Silicimonas sp.]
MRPRTMVEDYTNAFLVSFGVLTFLALFTIWAIWGLLVAGLVSWVADRLMTVDFRQDGKARRYRR